jgi:hypothetical protein
MSRPLVFPLTASRATSTLNRATDKDSDTTVHDASANGNTELVQGLVEPENSAYVTTIGVSLSRFRSHFHSQLEGR